MINKKIHTLLLSLAILPSAFSGTMGVAPCNSVLCAGNSVGGVYASIMGLYVQPDETGLGLVTDSWLYNTPNGPTALNKLFIFI